MYHKQTLSPSIDSCHKCLLSACHDGKLEEAQSALSKGADPNWKDQVSLQLTVIF